MRMRPPIRRRAKSPNAVTLPWKALSVGPALILALFFSQPALAQQKANVEGRVLTDHGVAIKSATVRLETDDGELVADQPVSTAGEFYFRFIPKKNYQLIVTSEG